MSLRIFCTAILCFFILALGAEVIKADDKIVDFHDMFEGDLVVDGFKLKSKTNLTIYAIGAEMKHSHDMFAYGWILDADTREPVWILGDEDTDRHRGSKYIREYEGEISLPAGKYEVYYYAGQPFYLGDFDLRLDNLDDIGDILENIFSGDKDKRHRYYSEDIDDLSLVIEAPEGSFTKYNPVTDGSKAIIVDFRQADDEFSEKNGFTLKKDMTVNIIAIGEYISSDKVFVDFGWIMNADTREKVWKMDKWNTSWSGGGRKNRGFSGEIKLPAGNYVAQYISDGSHSFGEWNVMPPFDPIHYGMLITPVEENDIKNVDEFVDDFSEYTIVQLTRVRDDEYLSKGFTLKKDADIHIIAIGECGRKDIFADYGWIENLDEDNIVWEMKIDNTEYAGGASKNRRFEGIVSLPPGNYMAHYITDDSHSYRRWNSGAPFDKNMWGLSIYGAGKKFDKGIVVTFDDAPVNSKIIVSITGVGDDEELSREFRLDKSQKVRIYALGEGKGREMYDYAWIEDSDGDVIWEMTYRKTRHAGGDRKNRVVDKDILLEPGEYEVFYVTDGSHSFPEFNASRPDQPHKWGITISKR